MKHNCLTYAVCYRIKNGGKLYIEIWINYKRPPHIHFTVEKDGKIFDYAENKREWDAQKYKKFPCKRIKIF